MVFRNLTKLLWQLPGFQAGLTNFETNNYKPGQHSFLKLENDPPESAMPVQGDKDPHRNPNTHNSGNGLPQDNLEGWPEAP